MIDETSDPVTSRGRGGPAAGSPHDSYVRVVHSASDLGPVTTVHVVGDLDDMTSVALQRAWQESPRLFRKHLHLDLTAVLFCNAAGLGSLIRMAEGCHSAGGTIELATSGAVDRSIEMAGVGDRLPRSSWLGRQSMCGASAGVDPSLGLEGASARLLTASAGDQEEVIGALVAAGSEITGVDSVHLALLTGRGRSVWSAGSAGPLGTGLFDAETGAGEGPGTQSRHDGSTVHVPDLRAADARGRWPRLTAAAHALPVRSVLCLDLVLPDRRLGTLTLSAARSGAFGVPQRQAGAVVAAVATMALSAEAERRHLGEALVHRDLIGQAKGILMARYRLTAQAAFDVLRTASSEHNTKLHVVAQMVTTTGDVPAEDVAAPGVARTTGRGRRDLRGR